MATFTAQTYAEVQRSIKYKKCLRHPDKVLVVQHDWASNRYKPWCVQCGVEGYPSPVLGRDDYLAEKEWDMATQALAKRDERIDALTVPTVRQLLAVGKATDTEIKAFILFCQAADANPFLREAYLIKYQEGSPASIVLALQWYLKRASHNPAYESYESGVIVKRADAYLDLPGAVPLPNDSLFGGWCRVWKKGATHPFERRVTMAEYDRKQAQWKTMPATMIEKVAIVQCVRRAFPDEFGAEERVELPVILEGDEASLEASEHAQVPLEKSTPSPSEPVGVSETNSTPASPPVDFEALVKGLPEVKAPQDLGKVARMLGHTPEKARALLGPANEVADYAIAVGKLVEHSPLRLKE